MSERLNFVALLEDVEEHGIRAKLIERFRLGLSSWIGAPTEVFLLGKHGETERKNWSDAALLSERPLSPTEILFIYFLAPESTKHVVLSIAKGPRAAVYGLSFPTLMEAQLNGIYDILAIVYHEISALNVRCVVAAGPELEIDTAVQSIKKTIFSTKELGSLIRFLCCDERDIGELTEFSPVRKLHESVILTRNLG